MDLRLIVQCVLLLIVLASLAAVSPWLALAVVAGAGFAIVELRGDT